MTAPPITIADAAHHAGETVQLRGWLYNLRKSGKIVFPIVRDGTGVIQCVALKSALPEEVFEELKHLTHERKRLFWSGDRLEWLLSRGFEGWFIGEITAGRATFPG